MMLCPIVCTPLGIYRNAETLRRCNRAAVSNTPNTVTLSFQTNRSPCPLLIVDLEAAQARELMEYLHHWFRGELDPSEGGDA